MLANNSLRLNLFFSLLLTGLFGLAGCGKKGPHGPPPGMAIQVVAVEAQKQAISETISLVGTVAANEIVDIKAEISGSVEGIGFEEGQTVTKGQILFNIDAGKLAASVSEAEANARLAKANYERSRALLQGKIVSQKEFDEATGDLETRNAHLEVIRQQLKDATILAPFAGVTGARKVSVGQVVNTQQILTSLADINPVKIEINVPERYIGELREGQKVEISVAAFPDKKFQGDVYFVSSQIDPVNRTGLIKAKAANEDLQLKPGMFARLDLTLNVRENGVIIPEAALILQGNQTSVFIVDHDLITQARIVKLGFRQPGAVEIIEGLEAGEKVIVEGFQKTRPGGKVKLAPPDSATPYLIDKNGSSSSSKP